MAESRLDQDIKKDVIDSMYWDDRVNAADVRVDVMNGKVTLSGSLATYGARMAAVADVWSVEGVRDVVNSLTVAPDYDVPSDDEIHARLDEMFRWNPDIKGERISVSVLNGVVVLTGSVSAYWKKEKAEQLAAEVNGVVEIKNDLTIVPTESPLDTDIAREIETALHRNAYVDAENVTVKVDEGTVRLTGRQRSWYARDMAGEIASVTLGVLDVQNDIVVI